MNVLVACEFSGVVRDAFSKKGHNAWSCDLLDTEKEGNHYKGNVLDILDKGWDLLIAHPPCTYLCNSGVRWLYQKNKGINNKRMESMEKGAQLFNRLNNCAIYRICIENPIPHKYAKEEIGKYSQIIQPWMFGHGETKATCLWLKNLPLLQPTNIVEGRAARIHKMSPSKDRGMLRSITYTGIAEAMASQWGCL